jgi:hypothetical protein
MDGWIAEDWMTPGMRRGMEKGKGKGKRSAWTNSTEGGNNSQKGRRTIHLHQHRDIFRVLGGGKESPGGGQKCSQTNRQTILSCENTQIAQVQPILA